MSSLSIPITSLDTECMAWLCPLLDHPDREVTHERRYCSPSCAAPRPQSGFAEGRRAPRSATGRQYLPTTRRHDAFCLRWRAYGLTQQRSLLLHRAPGAGGRRGAGRRSTSHRVVHVRNTFHRQKTGLLGFTVAFGYSDCERACTTHSSKTLYEPSSGHSVYKNLECLTLRVTPAKLRSKTVP